MSYKTYNTLWKKTQDDLLRVLQKDRELQKSYYEERMDLVHKLRLVYVQYVRIARHLDTCYDNIVQPQKRRLIRKILDLTLSRVVEIKHELVAVDHADIQHCDKAMDELQMEPSDLEVPLPVYIRRERLRILEEREAMMTETLRKAGLDVSGGEEGGIMSVYDAIRLIQRHERARQGRAKFSLHKQMVARQELDKVRGRPQLSREEAILRIQAFTRGMIARRKVKEMRKEEEIFLGLRPDVNRKPNFESKLLNVQTANYDTQMIREREERELRERLQSKILFEEGPALMADTEKTIREWFFQEKMETGKFPDLPDEDEGGSAAVLGRAGYFVRPPVSSQETQDRKSDKSRDQSKKKEDDDSKISVRASTYLLDLKKACDEYKEVWQNRDINQGCQEEVIEGFLETELRVTVEKEIRKQVDNLMRHELQRLKEEVEGEKKGAKKKKKIKKGKGRKRKEKDLTPDRTQESLFEELVLNGIIKRVPDITVKDLPGAINVAGTAFVDTTHYPMPSLADIRNVLVEYVALPLGMDIIRSSSPIIKSILLCGPRNSGKSTLITALCHDLGATLFDLTASNIVGRYPGRAGLNMLTHLILKVGRHLQPSVILVDEADKMFMKKIPKTDKSDPKRFKKELPRIVKNIGIEDKMIVIGISNSPWNCDLKSLTSVYQKILMVYRPTFGERCNLWRHLVSKAGGNITTQFDLASMSRISDGYATGHIENAINQVLTEQRLSQQEILPLTVFEFIQPLSKMEPIYKEEEEAMKQFFHKTPLMKRRARLLEEEAELALLKAKAASKGETKPKIKPKKKKRRRKKKKKE